MGVNAVLMKFFNLPPGVKMILALAGFGSLASIFFWVLPALKTTEGKKWVLIIGGIGLVLFLIIWGIRKLVAGKKSAKLGEALASQGPTRGDIAEQEQIYREKFRAKLAELKTNGLNVYKLPWFVLMGEPGCGKTASLIHSGLDFPLGKDEVPGFGGTRNYNWWFTNEAVILDTAGRIAFQEEGTTDKTEWEYFLKLLKANRPRCPVNGVIIALPADRLLKDSSDERSQKATILRERLRQVHQSLGVRFPTFVLVTKMDLVGGFSEFFEEIRVDLQQRNQMCGWSRPGEFQTPYDPSSFMQSFDQVYYRLRDWGMRYLQRKATEQELGMIVTFPEAFRELRKPLDDFVGTIFQKSPLLEPPFFRGFYFTSAVQEGAPIFQVLARSHTGTSIMERPTKAADSKAFFIHDFYAKKVFPEHGLVFRSAKHVSLNKRMRRFVWVGSGAMIALMLGFFGFGAYGVTDLVEKPRDASQAAAEQFNKPGDFTKFPGNVKLAKQLHKHIDDYNRPFAGLYARALFIGADIDDPRESVQTIHARFVLDSLLKPVLDETATRLAATQLSLAMPEANKTRYLAALTAYTKWYGEVVGKAGLPAMDMAEATSRRADYEAMLTFLDVNPDDAKGAAEEFEFALKSQTSPPRAFARDILRDTLKYDSARATATIRTGVEQIVNRWKPITQIKADNTDPLVRYWFGFATRVGELRARYDAMLALAQQFADDANYDAARKTFDDLTRGAEYLGDMNMTPDPGTLHESLFNFQKFLAEQPVPETAEHRIVRLSKLLEYFQGLWEKELGPIENALKTGAPDRAAKPQSDVYAAIDEGRKSLDTSFRLSLKEVREKLLGLEGDAEPLEIYINQGLIVVSEYTPPTPFEGKARITLALNPFGASDRVKNVLKELRAVVGGGEEEAKDLEDLRKWPALLSRFSSSEPAGDVLSAWFTSVGGEKSAATDDVIKQKSGFADRPFWKPLETFRLAQAMWRARQANSVDAMLKKMAAKAEGTLSVAKTADGFLEMPGLARLIPNFDQPASKLPFDVHRFNTGVPTTPAAAPDKPAAAPEPEGDGPVRRTTPAPGPATPADVPERERSRVLLREYHTRAMLHTTLREFEAVQAALKQRPNGEAVRVPLEKAADAYVTGYLKEWYLLYSNPTRLLDERTLTLIQKCGKGELSWPEYVNELSSETGDLGANLAERTQWLITEVMNTDEGLQNNPVDNAVWDRIIKRSADLGRERMSLMQMLTSMTIQRNQPGPAEGSREVVFSSPIAAAWRSYVNEVKALGTLGDDATRSTAALPSIDNLRKNIVYKDATNAEMRFIAPLIDIAEYGQVLLVHHLNTKLAGRFKERNGNYPVVTQMQALDDTAKLQRLRELPALDPAAFLKLLQEVADFQARYGEVFAKVQGSSPAMETLRVCQEWTKFLYEKPEALMRGDPPAPLKVWLAIARPDETTNAASVYTKFKIKLPLLTSMGNLATWSDRDTRSGSSALTNDVRSAINAQKDPEYLFDLFSAGKFTYERPTVEVFDRAADAAPAKFPERVSGWDMPPHPWSLLMLLSSRQDNDLRDGLWRIPVRLELNTGEPPIGFTIGLRIGSGDRPFPGPIPPLNDPGARPAMAKAGEYVK